MMVDRRVLTLVVMALIAGAALALAVALARGPSSQVTGLSTYGSAVQSPAGVPAQTQDLGATQPDPLAVDPARSAPMLDQFQPKDPFIPLQTPTPAPNPTSSPTPVPTPVPTPSNKKAVVKVNGATSTVVTGDKVPSGDPAFKITSVTASDVTFTLLSGQFSDGSSSVTVNLGEAVKVQNQSGGTSYTLSVVKIGGSGGGGSGSGAHSIAILSITTKNGDPVVTLRVGSVTYSDVTAGTVLTTSWGEIRIVSINASAQTVTLVHGSATLTLHTGQVVPK
jgi:hypothetical protein